MLLGAVGDAGAADALTIASGATLNVLSGGAASAVKVASGGRLVIAAGATAATLGLAAGGALVDQGALTYSGAASATLAGALSGAGALIEDGPGRLAISGSTAGFTGSAVLSGGVIELAVAGGLGSGSVVFAAAKTATLQIDAAARPASGGTFAATLISFDSTLDRVDLAGLAFVSGAKATVKGDVLTLRDGTYTAAFTLGGTLASGYVVSNDGAGGTLIRARASTAGAIVNAAAAFDPPRAVAAPHTPAPVAPDSHSLADSGRITTRLHV